MNLRSGIGPVTVPSLMVVNLRCPKRTYGEARWHDGAVDEASLYEIDSEWIEDRSRRHRLVHPMLPAWLKEALVRGDPEAPGALVDYVLGDG